MEIIMACEPISAAESYRLHLANRVVPEKDLVRATREFIGKIGTKSPTCIRITKRIALGASMEGFGNLFAVEPELMQGVVFTGETREGIKAFVAKRKPDFTSEDG